MSVRQPVHTLRTRCCTWRKIGPLVIVDEGGRHTMEAADMSKTKCTEAVSTTVPDHPEVRESRQHRKTSKESSQQNASIVERKATGRASIGRRRRI